MVNDIFFAAFHDEMAKVAGAKRLDRLRKLRHKSTGHEKAYRRAEGAYKRRIDRYNLPEKHRIAPGQEAWKVRLNHGHPLTEIDDKTISSVAGGALGTLAGGVGGLLAGDPLLAMTGAMTFGSVGGRVGGFVPGIRKDLHKWRGGKARKRYMKRIGMPGKFADPDLSGNDLAAVASKAVRAGSPKDIPTDMLRRRQKVATEPKDKARLQGYLNRIRNT